MQFIPYDQDSVLAALVGNDGRLKAVLAETRTAVLRPERPADEEVLLKLARALMVSAAEQGPSRPGRVIGVAHDGTLTVRYGVYDGAAIRRAVLTRDEPDGDVSLRFIDGAKLETHVPRYRLVDSQARRETAERQHATRVAQWVRVFGDYVPAA